MKAVWNKIKKADGGMLLLILIIYVAVVSLIGPVINHNALAVNTFLSWDILVMTIRQNAAYGIIACGLTYVIISGNIDLSIGSIYTLCACFCAKNLQYGLLPAIVMPLLVGLACGLINGGLIGGLKLNSFIVTIATMSVFASAAIIYTSSGIITPKNESAAVMAAFQTVGQGKLFGFLPMPIFIFIIVALITGAVLRYTTAGTKLYFVGSSPISARYSGIHTRLTVAASYGVCGLLTGLASLVTVSRIMSAQSQMGMGIELDIILAVVLGGASILGGKGTVFGSVIGILFIGFLKNGFTFMGIDNVYTQKIISGIILVAALIFDVMKERGALRWKKKGT